MYYDPGHVHVYSFFFFRGHLDVNFKAYRRFLKLMFGISTAVGSTCTPRFSGNSKGRMSGCRYVRSFGPLVGRLVFGIQQCTMYEVSFPLQPKKKQEKKHTMHRGN